MLGHLFGDFVILMNVLVPFALNNISMFHGTILKVVPIPHLKKNKSKKKPVSVHAKEIDNKV